MLDLVLDPVSLLDMDHVPDAGAAHGDVAGFQAVVVAMLRPLRPDPLQNHHLVPDGPGLQVLVLLPLQVQAALQQAARLRQRGREQRVVMGRTADRDGWVRTETQWDLAGPGVTWQDPAAVYSLVGPG